jgi:hypothetical protein
MEMGCGDGEEVKAAASVKEIEFRLAKGACVIMCSGLGVLCLRLRLVVEESSCFQPQLVVDE